MEASDRVQRQMEERSGRGALMWVKGQTVVAAEGMELRGMERRRGMYEFSYINVLRRI
jgi:hypothetical protein